MPYKGALTAVVVVAATISAPTFAQVAPASAGGGAQLGDIVVTATRRQESLQSIPVAVTAVSSEELKRSEIHDLKGLQFAAPSLNFGASTGDRSVLLASMRGIYIADSLTTLDPAVGIYLNGVYIARTTGLNLALVDLQRVEVLRGPQGTLFGRNTIGGAINMVPAEPTNDFNGSITGALGNYDSRRLTGIINVPIGENLAMRVAAEHSENSGWGRDTLLNERLNNDNINFVRVSLKATAGRLTGLLVYDYARLTGGAQLSKVIFANPCGGPNSTGPCTLPTFVGHPEDAGLSKYINSPFYENQGDFEGPFRVKAQGGSGILTYDLGGGATVKSITSYRTTFRTSPMGYDIDGTPYQILQTGNGKVGFALTKQHQFTEEFQVFGKALDNRLDWIGGLYYFSERSNEGPGYSYTLVPLSSANPSNQLAEVPNKSIGAFAQASYAITRELKVTGGIRYTEDKRQLITLNRVGLPPNEVCSIAASLLDVPGVCRATLPVRKFSYLPWTAGLDWKPAGDILIYGKVSRGFRAGGYNLRGSSATGLDAFGPESALAYEIGFKGSMLDRRLRVNAAVYNTEYSDIQVTRTVPTGIGTQVASRIDNAAKARIRGGELEIQALPTPDLKLSASGAIADAKYTEVLSGAAIKLTDTFLGVPKYTYSLAGDYHLNVPVAPMDFRLEWNWRSRVFYSQALVGSQPSYGILNGSVAIHPAAVKDLTVRVYARNLLGKKYYDRVLDQTSNAIGVAIGVPGAPRFFGGSVSYDF